MIERNRKAPFLVDPSAYIGEYSSIGVPSEESLRDKGNATLVLPAVTVGPHCLVMNFVTLHEGVYLAPEVVVEDYCRIGANSRIGPRTRVIYGAYICDDVVIGEDCRIAGFVCDDVRIEESCTVMGNLIHDYNQPHRDWYEVVELAPLIRHHSVVAFNSVVVGHAQIGPYSYVVAGAIVTKDVPSWHVALGCNQFVHWRDWPGSALKDLFTHWTANAKGDELDLFE